MTAAEGSFLGLAKQTGYGVPNVTDADFRYLLFRQGAVGPNSMTIPLDPEVGGGALLRSVVKVGVTSGGALDFIPRPETLGLFFYGVTGSWSAQQNVNDNGIAGPIFLTAQPQTGYNDGLHQPPTGKTLFVKGSEGASGSVTIHGLVDGEEDNETLSLNGENKVAGAKLFTHIFSLDLPAGAGETVSVGYDDDYYTHSFKLGEDQFAAPYFTVRSAPGNLWGEQAQDCRVNVLSLEWRGANYVGGAAGFLGGKPQRITDMTNWGALAKVDSGPQFLAPYGAIELPTGTSAKVLAGTFAASTEIPLDEQFVVGSMYPDRMDVVGRSFMLSLTLKISDDELYKRMQYDPAGGTAWTAAIMREANFRLYFRSDVGQYAFQIAANGSTGENANVFWSAAQIGMRAQRQLLMQVTGIFTASPDGVTDPIVLSLVNKRAAY